MKKRTKMVMMVLLSVSMSLGICQNGFAQQSNAGSTETQTAMVETEIEDAVTAKFSEYYSIDDVQLTLCGVHDVQGRTEYFYKVQLSAMLRYTTVEDMDYFQGLLGAAGIELEAEEIFSCVSRSADDIRIELQPYAPAVFNYLDEEYKRLDAYIGEQQIIPFYMKAVVDGDYHVELFMDAGDDYAPFEEYDLGTRDELKLAGALCMSEEMEEVAAACDNGVMSVESYAVRASSEANAVLYMVFYTSNPSVCDYCGGACDAIRDRSKWNNGAYPADNGHGDCANYISQALKNAGFADTEAWSYNTETWKRVSLLIPHMLSKGRIGIAPSGVIKVGYLAASSSHIMMVTAFDGVSYRYSAHTRDRRDVAMALGSSYQHYNVNYQ